MQRLEVSGAVRPIYGSLGVKRLITVELKAYWDRMKVMLQVGYVCMLTYLILFPTN